MASNSLKTRLSKLETARDSDKQQADIMILFKHEDGLMTDHEGNVIADADLGLYRQVLFVEFVRPL